MKARLIGMLTAACLFGLGQGAAAQDVLWGAVVVGPNGAYGWAVNAFSETQAEIAAMANCQGGCSEGFTFYDSCGAIALSLDQSTWYWGNGDDQWLAEENALDACFDDWGDACEIAVWACTD